MTTDPSTFAITDPFSQPYYEGGIVPEIGEGNTMPVGIDGRGFVVDLISGQFRRRSVQLINSQQQDQSQDGALLLPEVWRRYAESWHHGAGQERYDRQNSLPYRFDASEGIDPWQEWGISLLRDTKRIALLPEGKAYMVSYGVGSLFAGSGTTIFAWNDLDIADPSNVNPDTSFTADVSATQGNIVSVTSDGVVVYVLDEDGQVTQYEDTDLVDPITTPGTALITIPSFVTDRAFIRYVNGHLLIGAGPNLYDLVNIAGTWTLRGPGGDPFTHHLPGYRWVDACAGLNSIYALGGMGDRWHVHAIGIAQDATDITVPVVAAPLPEGEVGYALGSYLGYVLVGTNTGWRFGMPASDTSLTFGRLVDTSSPVRCFEGQDRFVWFGCDTPGASAPHPPLNTQGAGLGRADLSAFTSPMTPPYASDLVSVGHWGEVRNVATVGATAQRVGRRVYTIDGDAVWMEHDRYVPSGFLEQGVSTFNTNDLKRGLYAQIYCEPLHGKILIDAGWDEGNFENIASVELPEATTLGNIPLNRSFTTVRLRYTLFPSTNDDAGISPRLTRAEVRGVPVVGRSSQWTIPLIVHQDINWDDTTQGRDVQSDFDMLVGLVESRRPFLYREADQTFTLYAMDFDWVPYRLTDDRQSFQGLFTLTARETR